jgi:hypothetical protein
MTRQTLYAWLIILVAPALAALLTWILYLEILFRAVHRIFV